MNKAEYIQLIKEQIKVDADYITSFETTINVLAEIMEERDRVYTLYLEQGAKPTIIFESDRGAKNPKPNPLFKQWQELNIQALGYLRDLGLTAAGLRKLSGQIPKQEKKKADFNLDDFIENDTEPEPANLSPDQQKAAELGISLNEYINLVAMQNAPKTFED